MSEDSTNIKSLAQTIRALIVAQTRNAHELNLNKIVLRRPETRAALKQYYKLYEQKDDSFTDLSNYYEGSKINENSPSRTLFTNMEQLQKLYLTCSFAQQMHKLYLGAKGKRNIKQGVIDFFVKYNKAKKNLEWEPSFDSTYDLFYSPEKAKEVRAQLSKYLPSKWDWKTNMAAVGATIFALGAAYSLDNHHVRAKQKQIPKTKSTPKSKTKTQTKIKSSTKPRTIKRQKAISSSYI